MFLRCLVGRYAGEIQEYGTAVGLAALRTGAAERVIEGQSAVPRAAAPVRNAPVPVMKKRWKPVTRPVAATSR